MTSQPVGVGVMVTRSMDVNNVFTPLTNTFLGASYSVVVYRSVEVDFPTPFTVTSKMVPSPAPEPLIC